MTTKQSPKVTYYRGVPLDDELLDAYPEIWEPLPDTGMQQKPQQEIMEFVRGWFGNRPDVFVSGNSGVYYEEGNANAVFPARLLRRFRRRRGSAVGPLRLPHLGFWRSARLCAGNRFPKHVPERPGAQAGTLCPRRHW